MFHLMMFKEKVKNEVQKFLCKKNQGIDGILVVVGLCIVALLLCVVMKDQLTTFITSLVGNLTTKATTILGS